MSRTVLVLLVVGVVLATVLQPGDLLLEGKCGKNQQLVKCATPCPPTCDERNPICLPFACIPGCECKRGFLRNRHNECVLPCDCD